MVQIDELLGNKKIIDILVVFFSSDEINQKEVISRSGIAKGTAIKWLDHLVDIGFLDVRKVGVTNLYSLHRDNTLLKQIKLIHNISLIYKLRNLEGEVFLYGSASRGEDFSDSDIDILIISEKEREEFIDVIDKLSKKIKREISFNVFDHVEWSKMEKKDRAFWSRVEKDKILLR